MFVLVLVEKMIIKKLMSLSNGSCSDMPNTLINLKVDVYEGREGSAQGIYERRSENA
jgi:hypothetical protein